MPPLDSETPVHGLQPDEFRLREFQELRATIRERGHVRAIVTVLTFVSWAAILIGAAAKPLPLLVLVPLLILAAGFEIVFAVHVGVERLGRYLCVFYESPVGTPKWETAIAAFGQSQAATATGGSALLVPPFVLAALLNLWTAWVVTPGQAPEVVDSAMSATLLVAHGVFVARVFIARRKAARQRGVDTAAFRAIALELERGKPTKSN